MDFRGSSSMSVRVSCPWCRELGQVLAEDLGSLPHCPVCGHELKPEGLGEPAGPGRGGVIDEEIQSWLSEPGALPAGASRGDATCLACGYAGMMEYDSAGGDRIC